LVKSEIKIKTNKGLKLASETTHGVINMKARVVGLPYMCRKQHLIIISYFIIPK